MLSFGLDAGFESFPPLVNGLVHNRLIQVRPDLNKLLLQFSQITNRFLIHALLHDFIINGIQVRTTRQPQVRWSEIWRFITQEFDCWSCSVGWRVVLLEDVRVSWQLTDTWKPSSWYSAHTKLFKHNESTTEWQCTVWKIILGELILINLCRPALEVLFFIKHSVGIAIPEFRIPGSQPFSPIPNPAISGVPIPGFQYHKNYLKLYFFTRSLNYRNKNFNCPMNKIFYLQSTTACCAL